MAKSLKTQLACGPVKAFDILQIYRSMEISEKTLQITKKIIGIQSIRMNGAWYWLFPGVPKGNSDSIVEEGIV